MYVVELTTEVNEVQWSAVVSWTAPGMPDARVPCSNYREAVNQAASLRGRGATVLIERRDVFVTRWQVVDG